jgi:hypothetical protein
MSNSNKISEKLEIVTGNNRLSKKNIKEMYLNKLLYLLAWQELGFNI